MTDEREPSKPNIACHSSTYVHEGPALKIGNLFHNMCAEKIEARYFKVSHLSRSLVIVITLFFWTVVMSWSSVNCDVTSGQPCGCLHLRKFLFCFAFEDLHVFYKRLLTIGVVSKMLVSTLTFLPSWARLILLWWLLANPHKGIFERKPEKKITYLLKRVNNF